jgi:hypothetical protein
VIDGEDHVDGIVRKQVDALDRPHLNAAEEDARAALQSRGGLVVHAELVAGVARPEIAHVVENEEEQGNRDDREGADLGLLTHVFVLPVRMHNPLAP